MRPDYYGNQYQNNTYLQAITQGPGLVQPATLPPGYVPPIVGSGANGPSWLEPSDAIVFGPSSAIGDFVIGQSAIGEYGSPIIGVPFGVIGGGGKVQYYPAYATTSAAGQLTIGISAIGEIKQYHEVVVIVNGVVTEGKWA